MNKIMLASICKYMYNYEKLLNRNRKEMDE